MLVLGSAGAMTAGAGYEMLRVLSVNGLTALGAVMVALFVLLFGWIALAFTSACAGFWSLLRGDPRLGVDPAAPLPALSARTALLMPTYNEQPARVFATLRAMNESLHALEVADRFDIFILSDSTDPDIWIAEEAGFLALRQMGGGAGRIFYRHRPRNIGRKAGNIADWVSRFGAAYPHFLILDADSVMSGETLVRLAAAMERNARVGLIQTLPVIVGAATLFGRLQQFAAQVYGPVIAHGLAWWHGAESNYWGHNAMIRTRAFASCAGLPVLRGRAPFGGHILSHDFVEAALLRRGGWEVHMLPGLPGSFEEAPPSLTDLAIRDRRWCQGNLQHAAVLPARGLHWISRLHLLTGIGSYVAAPLWLMFLAIGLLIALQARFEPFDYFPAGRSLFPRWPQVDPVRARYLVRGRDGGAARAQAARLPRCGAAWRAAPIRGSLPIAARRLDRDGHRRAARPGRDADPEHRRDRDPGRQGCGMAAAAPRRRLDRPRSSCPAVLAAHACSGWRWVLGPIAPRSSSRCGCCRSLPACCSPFRWRAPPPAARAGRGFGGSGCCALRKRRSRPRCCVGRPISGRPGGPSRPGAGSIGC